MLPGLEACQRLDIEHALRLLVAAISLQLLRKVLSTRSWNDASPAQFIPIYFQKNLRQAIFFFLEDKADEVVTRL